jgi:chaperonin cofactor prefoldin
MIECQCGKCELLEARIRELTEELKAANTRIDELKEEIGELEYRERVFTTKGY